MDVPFRHDMTNRRRGDACEPITNPKLASSSSSWPNGCRLDGANQGRPATPYPTAGSNVHAPVGTPLPFNNGNLDGSSPQLNGYRFDPVITYLNGCPTTCQVAENNIYTPIGFSNGNSGISPAQLNGYHLDNANQSWPATTYLAAGNAYASVGLPLSLNNNGNLDASSSQLDGYHFGNANQAWPAGLSTCLFTESICTPAGLPVPVHEDYSTPLSSLDSSVGYDTIAESGFDGNAAGYSATYGHQINPLNSSFEHDAENSFAHEAIGSASVPIQNPSIIDGHVQPPLDIPTNVQNGTADTTLPNPSRSVKHPLFQKKKERKKNQLLPANILNPPIDTRVSMAAKAKAEPSSAAQTAPDTTNRTTYPLRLFSAESPTATTAPTAATSSTNTDGGDMQSWATGRGDLESATNNQAHGVVWRREDLGQ